MKIDPNIEIFNTTLGVRQGGIESPPLFCIYLDTVMRIYEKKLIDKKILSPTFKFSINNAAKIIKLLNIEVWSGYADNTTLYSNYISALQISLKLLAEIYTKYHLNLNIGKTETNI